MSVVMDLQGKMAPLQWWHDGARHGPWRCAVAVARESPRGPANARQRHGTLYSHQTYVPVLTIGPASMRG
jgi:hypothetical protein